MITRSIRGLCLLLALFIAVGSSVQAQIKTQSFNNNTVKENSIVIKYDDTIISARGKTATPQSLAATLMTEINALKGRTIEKQNVEEWILKGDMGTTLDRLNSIPGVTAFPNYVFYRDEMEIGEIDFASQLSLTPNGENLFPDLETLYGPEIIQNGDFGTGDLSSWSTFLADWIPIGANFGVTDGVATVTDITGSLDGTPWYIQLNQEFSDDQVDMLNVGGLYELTFDISTDSLSRDVHIYFGQNGGDFISVLDLTISVDTNVTSYIVPFYLNAKWYSWEAGMKLGFEGGLSDASMFIDNVSIRQANSPIIAAPTPGLEDDMVISIYSDAYTNVPVDTLITEWSDSNFEIDSVGSDYFIVYDSLNFVGIETVANQLDVTGMTNVHFNVWTPNADEMRFKLVDFGPDGVYSPAFDGGDDTEYEVVFNDFPKSVWLTADIPLYVFEQNGMNLNNIAQIIYSAGPSGESTLAIDNLLFYDNGLPTNDPLLTLQYGLNNDGFFNPGYSVVGADVDAFSAWEFTTGSDDVIMVVYDDGVDFSHPDLYDNRWVNPGEDIDNDGVITDADWNGIDDDGNGYPDDFWGWSPVYNDNRFLNSGSFHGTHVAGILGAQGDNGIGVSGVAQDVTIINVMIFNEFGGTDAISIMAGYQYISDLLDAGVDITGINQSWGGGGYLDLESDQQFVTVMTDYALDHAEHAALWIVSAGNSASNRDDLPFYSYPNNIQAPNIVTVASTDDADNLSGFSDYGVFTVDVAAPGSNILSTFPPSAFGLGWEYAYLSGTSMASPHVSGIIALAKSMYPDEDGYDLMTRLLAGNEDVPNLDGETGAGGRVNAMGTLDSDSVGNSGDIVGGNTNQFHRTFIDDDALETTGIVNNTDGDVTVTGLALSGPNADNFYIMTDTESLPTLAAGEAFGILVGFNNDGLTGDLTATLTVSTDAGDASLALVGHEQGFGFVDVSPGYEWLGAVPYGTELNTTFTVSNFGNADMNYELQQFLFFWDLEWSTFYEDLISFEKEVSPVEKTGDNNEIEILNDITAKVLLERGDRERPVIKANPSPNKIASFTGPELIWFDDLNDADSVDHYWDVLDFSDGAGSVWSLYDVGVEDTNNVFLFGDFDFGYLNNSTTVAVTPTFDFSGYAPDRGPSYLMFDVDVQVEDFWDEFFLNVVIDGVPYAYIGGSNTGEVINYGGYNTVYVDISRFSGYENVEFWFIAYSDASVIGGFGALFDNVGVVVDDFPFFTSVQGGELAPGSSEDVDLTVRTALLPAGDWILFTDVYANGFISYYGNGGGFAGHVAEFSARNVALDINPWFQYLGEVPADETLTYTFDATNIGTVPVDYYARNFFSYFNPVPQFYGGGDAFGSAGTEALERFEQRVGEDAAPFDVNARKEFILDAKKKVNLSTATSGSNFNPTTQSHVDYFEDFEGGVLPEGWEVYDNSFGLGSVFEVENFGTEEDPYNTLYAGEFDPETGYSLVLNNSSTIVFSPYIDVSNTPTSEGLRISFDYSFLMEPGWDFASVWIGYTQGENEYLFYLGSSEDIFNNDGGEYNAGFGFGDLTQDDDIYIAFMVESDSWIQSGWAYVDNIEISSFDRLAYVGNERGTIDSAATETFEVTVNTPWLRPGEYEIVTFIDYYSDELWVGRGAEQYTFFEIENQRPVAEDDWFAAITDDVIPFDAIIGSMLFNDYDPEGSWLYLYDVEEPLYGDIRYTFDGMMYVAPEEGGKTDMFRYIITDGQKMDTATVYIEIGDNPHFPTGADKQYVLLEDDSLSMSTIGMASGVGFWGNVGVWAAPHSDAVTIEHDVDGHSITIAGAENAFGHFEATFYVGTFDVDGNAYPWDSTEVSIVITPVNDAPVAAFTSNIDGSTVSFANQSNDAIDMNDGGIASFAWDFGDGSTSTDAEPTYDYGATGDFTITLVVTDIGGLSTTVTETITIMSVSSEVEGLVPTEFAIQQNYPNPFNPSTNINYSLPEASSVTIVVYDLLGQKVAELVNAEKAAGYHTVAFDASALSSGVYIYQIKAGAFTQTKKMMLIK